MQPNPDIIIICCNNIGTIFFKNKNGIQKKVRLEKPDLKTVNIVID